MTVACLTGEKAAIAYIAAMDKHRVDCLASWICRWKSSDAVAIESLLSRVDEIYSRAPEVLKAALNLVPSNVPALPWLRAYVFEKEGDFSSAAAVLDSFVMAREGLDTEPESLRLFYLASMSVSLSRWSSAIRLLQLSIRMTERPSLLRRSCALLATIGRSAEIQYKRKYRVALIGNASFEFILPAIKLYAFALGIEVDVRSGSYNQHWQEVLDQSTWIHSFRPEIVVIATNWRSLELEQENSDADGIVAKKAADFLRLWDICRDRWGAFVVQQGFEIPSISPYGRLSAAIAGGRARIVTRINLSLAEAAELRPDVAFLDVEQIAATEGKRTWDDERLWIAARQYPSARSIPSLARKHVAVIRAYAGLTSKCLVLDLDGTLWGGVIAEDGLAGITLGNDAHGEAFVEFQNYLRGMRQRGILLAACSRNTEVDAKLPFTSHPNTVLRLDDFAAFVANFNPKSENVLCIARELNIGVDSMVFVDNEPFERGLIRREIPEVEVPEMPAEPALFPAAIDETMAFEAISLTAEDRLRGAHSLRLRRTQELRESLLTLDDYLLDLKMRLSLLPIDASSIARALQLLGKTNQFNVTTRRLTATELEKYMTNPSCYTQAARLSDRFEDYGLTGILLGSVSGAKLMIDVWLMSCRVLGRRMENAMLAAAWNWAQSRGLEEIRGFFLPTAKNSCVANLYDRLGFSLLEETQDGTKTYIATLRSTKAFPSYFSVIGA